MSRFYGTASVAAKFKKVTHVLFDLDGLILDSEPLYTSAIERVIATHGKVLTREVKTQLLGLTGRDASKLIVKLLDLPISSEQYYAALTEQYDIVLPEAKLLPGAERLIRHLHAARVPIAVATSSGQESFELKTRRHAELFSLFHHVVAGGSDPEVKAGKPAPDVFLVCASRFSGKPKADECLVFEDAPNGVTAAIAAGMQVVMVPDKETDESLCRHATLKLNSLEEMQPELFGLPKF